MAESPAKEHFEQVKCCEDTDCTHQDDETGLPCVERRETGKNTKVSSESREKPRNGPLNAGSLREGGER